MLTVIREKGGIIVWRHQCTQAAVFTTTSVTPCELNVDKRNTHKVNCNFKAAVPLVIVAVILCWGNFRQLVTSATPFSCNKLPQYLLPLWKICVDILERNVGGIKWQNVPGFLEISLFFFFFLTTLKTALCTIVVFNMGSCYLGMFSMWELLQNCLHALILSTIRFRR